MKMPCFAPLPIYAAAVRTSDRHIRGNREELLSLFLGNAAAARCGFGKILEPGLDFVDSKAGTRDGPAPVLTSASRSALQRFCPVHDLSESCRTH